MIWGGGQRVLRRRIDNVDSALQNLTHDGDLLGWKLKRPFETVFSCVQSSNWLRLVETLRTASNNFEDYEFEDLAAAVEKYEPSLALSFGKP